MGIDSPTVTSYMGDITPSEVTWRFDDVSFDEYYASVPGRAPNGKTVHLKFLRSHIESEDGDILWED